MERKKWQALILVSFFLLGVYILAALGTGKVLSVIAENKPIASRRTVIIDAGHGGEDGGAVSCTGVLESDFNLKIALKLNDLMHLLGIKTVMIRITDCSVYTHGTTIAQKKVSDLKERVRIVNETENALLISIHQNFFSQNQYSGAQVFYREGDSSKHLAEKIQEAFVNCLNEGSNRKAKKAEKVYLMQHIQCDGILVECGFLSNPEEEAKLRTDEYQRMICCIIASVCSEFLHCDRSLT